MVAQSREIFISYSWEGISEQFVNRLDQTLQQKGIIIIRDKRDVGYKGLINEFMEDLGRGKCVIAVIDDKYLKSPNCMSELVQVAKNGRFNDRIFPIVLPDARIYDSAERLEYIQHWEDKKDELNRKMKTVGQENLDGFRDDIDLYTEIRNEISKLTYTLKNMNTLTPDMHSDSDFEDLIKSIEDRLNEPETQANEESGRGKKPSNFLPFLADRESQEKVLKDTLKEIRESHPEKMLTGQLVCLIHGNRNECFEKFVELLESRILPRLLNQKRHQAPPSAIDVTWPRDCTEFEAVKESIYSSLYKWYAKDAPVDDHNEIAYAVNRRNDIPLLVFSTLGTINLKSNYKQIIKNFQKFCKDWPNPSNKLIIWCLLIQYLSEKKSKFIIKLRPSPLQKANNEIKKYLNSPALHSEDGISTIILPELDKINLNNADAWTKIPDVKKAYPDRELSYDIDKIYTTSKVELPMEEFAKQINKILNSE